MLTDFIFNKLKEARYKVLEDGQYFGEIPSLKGIWATARDLESCREELQEVLEDWLVLKLRQGERVPGLIFEKPSFSPKILAHA
jgi:predicted RNase H-like HicB family nuclease